MNISRKDRQELNVGAVLTIEKVDRTDEWYHVLVGKMGVIINDKNWQNSVQLVDGSASRLDSLDMAMQIAEKVGGKVVRIVEKYKKSEVHVWG